MRISDWSSDVCSSDLIALIEDGVAQTSVVHAPALARTYAGAAGRGALRVRGAQREAIRTRRVPATPPIWLVSKSHRNAALEALLARESGRASCRERVCQDV